MPDDTVEGAEVAPAVGPTLAEWCANGRLDPDTVPLSRTLIDAICHDHPFAKWKRDEFWGLAAFFAGIRPARRGGGLYGELLEVADRRELAIPNTERVAQATPWRSSPPSV